MANDRNSGMNIPIPFRQIITKYHNKSTFAWLDTNKLADVNVGVRDSFNSVPATITMNIKSDEWLADSVTNVWVTGIVNWVKPTSVTQGGGALALVVNVDAVVATKYFWDKGKGLYVYSVAKPIDDNVVIVIPGEAYKNIYALTDFGLNSEELLNSPNMEISDGFYALIENLPQYNDDAVFRVGAAANDRVMLLRWSMGQNGFFNSFIRHRNTRPWQFSKYESNYFYKYVYPYVNSVLLRSYLGANSDTFGDYNLEWDENINVICSSAMKDLESVIYGDLEDIATEVWEDRNRAFVFGIWRHIEYTGAVHANWYDFIAACNRWYICIMKINGKVQDWVKALYTTNAGVGYTNVTSNINLKNTLDLDFNDISDDWIELASTEKPLAFTINFNAGTVVEDCQVEYLQSTGPNVWVALTEYHNADATAHGNHYNSTNEFQKKTIGDFYRFDFYTPTDWIKKTNDGTSAYWIRIRLVGDDAGRKLGWVVMSGVVITDATYTGNLIENNIGTWSQDSSGFVPLSLKYFENKKSIWGCFYDIHTRRYYPFAIQLVKSNIDDSTKRSYVVSEMKLFDDYNNYNYGKKFKSFEMTNNTEILSCIVDDKDKNGTTKIVKFGADFNGASVKTGGAGSYIGKYKGRLIYQGATNDELIISDGVNEVTLDLSSFAGDNISATAEYGGNLYIVRYGGDDLIKFDGTTLTKTLDLTGATNCYCMVVCGDYLYIGASGADGGKVYETTGIVLITTVTFGTVTKATAMCVFNDLLYVGFDDELIENYDGVDWTIERVDQNNGQTVISFFELDSLLYATVYDSVTGLLFKRASNGVWDNAFKTFNILSKLNNYYGNNKTIIYNGIAYIACTNINNNRAILAQFNGKALKVLYVCVNTSVYGAFPQAEKITSLVLFGDTIYCIALNSTAGTNCVVSYNVDEYKILDELPGGESNLPSPFKLNESQIIFPENTSVDMLKKYAIAGCTNNKSIVWEYSNRRNFYVNIHSVVNDSLRDIVKGLIVSNNSVFYTNCDGELIFKNKNIKGLADSIYTLSNRAGYGEGVIKTIDNIKLYENIINKLKINWSGDLFGSGSVDMGTGYGMGKQMNISENIIDNKFKVNSVGELILSNYSNVREYLSVEAIILYFLELTDVIKIKLEHPTIYIDSTKEWFISNFTFDINQLTASLELIERVLEE